MAERFEVVDQQRMSGERDDKTYGDVVKVSFRIKPSGELAFVNVPAQQYGAAEVARRIHQWIDAHDEVAGL